MQDFSAANPFELARQADPNGADCDAGPKAPLLPVPGQAAPAQLPLGAPCQVAAFPSASSERCMGHMQPHQTLLLPVPSLDSSDGLYGGVSSRSPVRQLFIQPAWCMVALHAAYCHAQNPIVAHRTLHPAKAVTTSKDKAVL